MYDLNAKVSEHYTLGQFLVTNQALTRPNMPEYIEHYDNLLLLADAKEKLDYYIGPSYIVSAYRTKELQDILKSQGEPVASGKSFHEVGRGIDISPTNMELSEFFGKLLASPLRSDFAEIAIKPGQNAIHLAINTPSDVREPKVTGLNEQGIYSRLSVDEIAKYIQPYMESASAAVDEALNLVTYNKTPLYIALIAALGGLGFYLYKRFK